MAKNSVSYSNVARCDHEERRRSFATKQWRTRLERYRPSLVAMPLTHDHNATRRSETWVPGDPDLRDDDSDEEREDATAEPRTRPTYASDQRLAIFRTYANWVAGGKKHANSPMKQLIAKYGCSKNYPKQLYDKVMQYGGVDDRPKPGRPAEFTEEVWEHVRELIREARDRKTRYSSEECVLKLEEAFEGEVPAARTIREWKQQAGYKEKPIVYKPLISKRMMKERLAHAKKHRCASDEAYIEAHKLTVSIDETWTNELLVPKKSVDVNPNSPFKKRFEAMGGEAESEAQGVKIMWLCAVTSEHKIGCYELDFKTWNAENVNPLSGKHAKGVTAAFLKPYLIQVAKDAKRKLGRTAEIKLLFDKAPSHKSLFKAYSKDKDLQKWYKGGIELAPAKGPDMSMLDAGVNLYLKREIRQNRASTAAQQRAAMRAAWEKIPPSTMTNISKRVRRNMLKVIEQKGGNFYDE